MIGLLTDLDLLKCKVFLLKSLKGWFELEKLELEVFEMLSFI